MTAPTFQSAEQIACTVDKPRHQHAQDWAEQVEEHMAWMEGATREIFLTSILEIAVCELSDLDIAMVFGDVWPIENILREAKELYGEDE